MKVFKSTHNLPFEATKGSDYMDFNHFRIGSCTGLWRAKNRQYQILSIVNTKPHNGHLEDVFDWFKQSCKRDRYNLVILEIFNRRFKKHLMEKRGFKEYHINDLILISPTH